MNSKSVAAVAALAPVITFSAEESYSDPRVTEVDVNEQHIVSNFLHTGWAKPIIEVGGKGYLAHEISEAIGVYSDGGAVRYGRGKGRRYNEITERLVLDIIAQHEHEASSVTSTRRNQEVLAFGNALAARYFGPKNA